MKTALLRELPPEERPREKLLRRGPAGLSNRELVAILLGSGTKDLSAVELADRVLTLCPEGLAALACCVPEELETVPGIGTAKACQIVAALELGRRVQSAPKQERITVSRPDEIAALFMEEMRCLPQEVFRVLLVNVRGEILYQGEVSKGSLYSTEASPREVFRDAVRRNAAAIAVVHNHPSGDPQPSREDIRTTRRLEETGRVLGIPLFDHIIIGDGTYVSLREEGHLRKDTDL